MRSVKPSFGEAEAFFGSAEFWVAIVSGAGPVLAFVGLGYAIGIVSLWKAAACSLAFTLMMTGMLLSLRCVSDVAGRMSYGAATALAYVVAVTAWSMSGSENGDPGTLREFIYVVWGGNPSAAYAWLMRSGRWYHALILVPLVAAFFAGTVVSSRLGNPARPLAWMVGVLFLVSGLAASAKVRPLEPLRQFYGAIAQRRADMDLAGVQVSRLSLRAAGKRSFPDKLWVHRTDSAEKLAALFGKHVGFELDLVFHSEGRYFDVTHPPVPSIGLTLDKFFASQPGIAAKYFWLDFKNLTDDDADASLAELSAIAERFAIKRHVIVESDRPDLLASFSRAGFYTSFYLPRRGPRDEGAWLKEIAVKLARGYVNAISTNGEQYALFSKTQFFDYDVLVWDAEDVGALQSDPRVKVILVERETPFER